MASMVAKRSRLSPMSTNRSQRRDLDEMLHREEIANRKKHWVRAVTACNSKCLFCLDADTPRNVYLDEAVVKAEVWSPNTPASAAVALRLKEKANVNFQLIDAPGDHDPVALYAPPDAPAASFDRGDSWPQWSPNAVDYLP